MKKQNRIFILLVVIVVVTATGLLFFQKDDQKTAQQASVVRFEYYQEYDAAQLQPLPEVTGISEEKAALGEKLFHDPRMSHDNSISCASCHALDHGGIDSRSRAVGLNGAVGQVNTPTVFNSSLNFRQFWDGRAATLEEQAAGPVHNPIEMGSSWDEIIPRLNADSAYPQQFRNIYDDEIKAEYIVDAIATFEATLLTPDSRFDRFLKGEEDVLTEDEKKGYRLFTSFGCSSCHQGANIGANMYQKFGVVEGYFENRPLADSDYGLFNVTGWEEDRFVFKVPSLRNVAVTAPYFHDGRTATLEQAVFIMGRYQLGRDLTEEETRLIVAFLKTLTGQWRGQVLK